MFFSLFYEPALVASCCWLQCPCRQVLCGHEASVTSVAISLCLDLAVTGSKDGTVNVHGVKEGQVIILLSHWSRGHNTDL